MTIVNDVNSIFFSQVQASWQANQVHTFRKSKYGIVTFSSRSVYGTWVSTKKILSTISCLGHGKRREGASLGIAGIILVAATSIPASVILWHDDFFSLHFFCHRAILFWADDVSWEYRAWCHSGDLLFNK